MQERQRRGESFEDAFERVKREEWKGLPPLGPFFVPPDDRKVSDKTSDMSDKSDILPVGQASVSDIVSDKSPRLCEGCQTPWDMRGKFCWKCQKKRQRGRADP